MVLLARIRIYTLHTTADCEEGDVRLQDGTDPSNGRVEVCHDGIWSSLCSDRWNLSDARVLCKQLGFESEGFISCLDSSILPCQ